MFSLFIMGSCSSKSEQFTLNNDQDIQSGRFSLFVSEELAEELESGEAELPEGVSFTRALHEDPEFEARHRAAGLHRWYYAECDGAVPSTKAAGNLASMKGLIYMEETPLPETDAVIPFNDPSSGLQWHLNNMGTIVSGAKMDCDINVVPAWEKFGAGNSGVTVAVIDTGIQPDHPDLDGVVLPAGSSGSRSFLKSKLLTPYDIEPQRHGTHVAGIIAAINNNGVGGCGIAGGNDGSGGVRILDCQAIASEEGDSGNTFSALVWAADHGAVLVNNSWNYSYDNESDVPETTPSDIKYAIDYFINNAGKDSKGNQTGPMKGGVVFFSAGNKSWMKSQPSMYEGVIAVGATGPAGESSYYTNYGDWVDICAPGGSYNPYGTYDALIYSTVSGNGYAQMQGTSQAAPMACGVAALLVSKYGGPGFTNTDLKALLLGGADKEDVHERKIGPSLDAYESFACRERILDPVKDLQVSGNGSVAKVKWTAGKCGDGPFYAYKLLLSENESSLQGISPFNIPSGVREMKIAGALPGKELSATFKQLDSCRNYYVTAIGYTRSHQYPEGNSIVSFRTNGAPTISRTDGGAVELGHRSVRDIIINCSDPDGDELTLSVDTGSPACSWSYDGSKAITLHIDASKAAPGYYFVQIKADDGNAVTRFEMKYTILENFPVKLKKQIQDMMMDAGSNLAIDLGEYFEDPDGDPVIYEVSSSSPELTTVLGGSVLNISCKSFCISTLTVSASDGDTKASSSIFKLRVQDDPSGICINSSVVSDKLLISCAEAGEAKVTIYSSTGRKLYSKNIYQTPFGPAEVSLASVAPGRLYLFIEFGGKKRKISIVKI